ncbi:2,3-diaminopropionate biosynthesis protein SbnA [Paenibacillus taichungensis]|uniref:2,3-diaminopropionate biosynthesis protein SbnA n=1 Tax=Paenibacillus taichungensis TaxID=484184 RepID=UPI0038CF8879
MLDKLVGLKEATSNTPLIKLQHEKVNLYSKLEFCNMFGNIKARPALFILMEAIRKGEVNQDTVIVESSSGNFALSLASICQYLGLKFIAVIDPNINSMYEKILRIMCHQVVKVTERDDTGGYLLTRLNQVHEICDHIENSYWTNQYSNPNNFWAHYHGLGVEITQQIEKLDYVFIGVSSGGTISGLSRRLKESFPKIKIIAVDSVGSVIFSEKSKKRYIPGIGSSIRPEILKEAVIDEVIHVPEINTVNACRSLLEQHAIFAGGSSGSCYAAINTYFSDMELVGEKKNVLFICPDAGWAYSDTIYNPKWVEEKYVFETNVSLV